MNTYTKEKFSLGQISALAALILGSLILAFAWAPSTVHADSATDQYTEPQTPTKPPTDNSGGNGGDNSGGAGASDTGSGGSDSTYVAPDTDTDTGTSSGGTGGSSGDQSDDGKKDGKSKDDKDKKSKSDDKDSKDSDAAAALSGSDGGDGGGGSSLPLIIALVIGIPALAVGGWYLYRRYGPQDEEARERLRHLVKPGGRPSRPPEKP